MFSHLRVPTDNDDRLRDMIAELNRVLEDSENNNPQYIFDGTRRRIAAYDPRPAPMQTPSSSQLGISHQDSRSHFVASSSPDHRNLIGLFTPTPEENLANNPELLGLFSDDESASNSSPVSVLDRVHADRSSPPVRNENLLGLFTPTFEQVFAANTDLLGLFSPDKSAASGSSRKSLPSSMMTPPDGVGQRAPRPLSLCELDASSARRGDIVAPDFTPGSAGGHQASPAAGFFAGKPHDIRSHFVSSSRDSLLGKRKLRSTEELLKELDEEIQRDSALASMQTSAQTAREFRRIKRRRIAIH